MMHPDEELKTTLAKWPFVLGDVILVAVAIAIALLGNWQLSNWQVASCVMAVALGAALFVLPYVVEFRVRIGEEAEDRAGELRAMFRQLEGFAQSIEVLDKRLRRVEALGDARAPLDALEDECRRLSSELMLLNQRYAALLETNAQLRGELTSEMEDRLTDIGAPLQALREHCSKLEASLADQAEAGRLEHRIKMLEDASAHIREEVDTLKLPSASAPAVVPEAPRREKGPDLDRPKREPRARHRPEESRLLQRAIAEKQDHAASAVARIIESKGSQRSEPESEPAPSPHEVGAEPEAAEAPESVSAGPTDLMEPAESSAGEVSEPVSIAEDAPSPEDGAAPVSAGAATDGRAVTADAPEEIDTSSAGAPVETSPEAALLFAEDPAPPAPKKVRIKKDDTVLTASIFIGIGNKPYLRGHGGGLSWEHGQPMEFEEIGKWRWVAPAGIEEPIEFQVFRNDEDPDRSGRFQLKPGERLEISPVF